MFLNVLSFPECLLTCNNEVCKCGSYDVEANIAMEIRVSKIHLNILIHTKRYNSVNRNYQQITNICFILSGDIIVGKEQIGNANIGGDFGS